MRLWPVSSVTLTFDLLISAKFEEIPSRRSLDTVFMRIKWYYIIILNSSWTLKWDLSEENMCFVVLSPERFRESTWSCGVMGKGHEPMTWGYGPGQANTIGHPVEGCRLKGAFGVQLPLERKQMALGIGRLCGWIYRRQLNQDGSIHPALSSGGSRVVLQSAGCFHDLFGYLFVWWLICLVDLLIHLFVPGSYLIIVKMLLYNKVW